jgi:uncharacterized protein (TIGR04255 family)
MTGPQNLSEKTRVKFQSPPINELVIAIYYLPITELKAQHIGIYWQRIYDKYPICEQQSPIVPVGGESTVFQNIPGEIFPLPRFWFRSNAHPTLIQIQRNAFMLNWRRVQNNEYPHYENVEKEFWDEIEIYKAFIQDSVGAKLDVVNRCELTYINVIARNEFFSSRAEIKNVLPSIEGLCNLQNEARDLAGLNVSAIYKINDHLLIDVTTKLGRRTDTKEEIAILEIKAHGAPGDLSLGGARNWYKAAHETIYETFLTITNERVQKEIWKPL